MSIQRALLEGIRVNQVWIIQDSGICLFHSSFVDAEDHKYLTSDANLFSGFLTALTTLAKEFSDAPIRKIALENQVYHYYKKQNLIICLSTEKEILDETVLHKFFERLLMEFETQFGPSLLTDDAAYYNVDSFEQFQPKLFKLLDVKLVDRSLITNKIPSFTLLFAVLDKNADRVIYSVIVGEKIAVIGEKAETELLISTLERFSPHKSVRKVYWANTPLEDADLIGIPPKLEKYYANQGYKILDIKNPGKFQGSSNKFISKIIKDVKKVDDVNSAEYLIKTRMDYFISRVSTLLDFYNREEITKNTLEILKRDIDKDLFELIETYIRNTINPKFNLPIQKNIWARLDGF